MWFLKCFHYQKGICIYICTINNLTYLKLYPVPGWSTSGAILKVKLETKKRCQNILKLYSINLIHSIKIQECIYQHGVPTNVFLDLCLSPLSNMQAETPKSPSFTIPALSIRMLPAYIMSHWAKLKSDDK
jgi:hypothetical protein